MRRLVAKLKKKWNIRSDKDFILIMLVFSLAGMGVSIGRRYVFLWLGLTNAPAAEKVAVSLLLIVPLYQLSTLVFALPLGQFRFFLDRQRELHRVLLRWIRKTLKHDRLPSSENV